MYDSWRCIALLIITKIVIITNSTIVKYDSKMYADFSILLDDLADNGLLLKIFTLKTRRECVLECLSLLACKSVNHKKDGGNCELLERSLNGSTPFLSSRAGWTYLTTNDEDLDTGATCKMLSPCENGGICVETQNTPGFKCTCDSLHSGKYCEKEREFSSCKEVYSSGFRTDGVYMLQNMGYHYCVLTSLSGCSAGGWTLILKTDGSKTTFRYRSSYWKSNNVYNQIYGLRQGLDGQEAKFDAFNKLSFEKVCLGMRQGSEIRFLQWKKVGVSMLQLTQGDEYESTSFGRSKWLGLLSGSDLQSHCNREGFNNKKLPSGKYVRFGIFGNNENHCLSIDSVIGIGIGGFYGGQNHIKTGVHVANGKQIKAKGYLLIQ